MMIGLMATLTTAHWADSPNLGLADSSDGPTGLTDPGTANGDLSSHGYTTFQRVVMVPAGVHVVRVVAGAGFAVRGHSYQSLYALGFPIHWRWAVYRGFIADDHVHSDGSPYHPIHVECGTADQRMCSVMTNGLPVDVHGYQTHETLSTWTATAQGCNTRRSDYSYLVDDGVHYYTSIMAIYAQHYESDEAVPPLFTNPLTYEGVMHLRVLYETSP